eukprot:15479866-Alexandrium_andersonii.AAC.1
MRAKSSHHNPELGWIARGTQAEGFGRRSAGRWQGQARRNPAHQVASCSFLPAAAANPGPRERRQPRGA